MSRNRTHYFRSASRDEGVLLKMANPLRINFDGSKLLCGFDCKRQAKQMVTRTEFRDGKWKEILTPYCGQC